MSQLSVKYRLAYSSGVGQPYVHGIYADRLVAERDAERIQSQYPHYETKIYDQEPGDVLLMSMNPLALAHDAH